MQHLATGIAAKIGCILLGALAGLAWLALDSEPTQTMTYGEAPADPGRTLTAAERRASADCVPMVRWKRNHDGYPPPFVLVKPTRGGSAERLPFDTAWRLAEQGKVWTHAACANR